MHSRLFRSRAQAEAELIDVVADEPEWVDLLSVVEVELPEPSLN